MKNISVFLVLTLSFFATSCSKSGGDINQRDAFNENEQFVISESHLNFEFSYGKNEIPKSQSVYGGIRNLESDVYIKITNDIPEFISSASITIDEQGGELLLIPEVPNGRPVGVLNDSIVISACRDSNCTNHFSGSPKTINIRYEVKAPLFNFESAEFTLDAGKGGRNVSTSVPFGVDVADRVEYRVRPKSPNDASGLNITLNGVILENGSTDSLESFFTAGKFRDQTLEFAISEFNSFALGVNTREFIIEALVEDTWFSRTIPLNVVIPPQYLWVDTNAFLFSDTNELTKESVFIKVGNSINDPSKGWHAEADQPWINIHENGSETETLEISIAKDGLSENTLHIGKVSVTSSSSLINNTQEILIGFWNNTNVEPDNELPHNCQDMVLAPGRPYIYMACEKEILAFNTFTKELVFSTENLALPDFDINKIEIYEDGKLLSIRFTNHTSLELIVLDLENLEIKYQWNLSEIDTFDFRDGLLPSHYRGTPLLIDARFGDSFNVESGATYYDPSFWNESLTILHPDTQKFCTFDSRGDPRCYSYFLHSESESMFYYEMFYDNLSAKHGASFTADGSAIVALKNNSITRLSLAESVLTIIVEADEPFMNLSVAHDGSIHTIDNEKIYSKYSPSGELIYSKELDIRKSSITHRTYRLSVSNSGKVAAVFCKDGACTRDKSIEIIHTP